MGKHKKKKISTVEQLKAAKKEIRSLKRQIKRTSDKTLQKYNKMWDLVRYARFAEHRDCPNLIAVRNKYPEDIKALELCDSNWQHGFNSGVLGMAHYVRSILHVEETVKTLNPTFKKEHKEMKEPFAYKNMTIKSEVERIEEEFPMLDT